MGKVQAAVGASVVGAALWWWLGEGDPLRGAPRSPNGFVSVAMPNDAPANTVLILSPEFGSDGQGRANALAFELQRAGVPFVRGSSYNVFIPDVTDEQEAAMKRGMAIFQQASPAVFVNGMAKSNPTAAQVIAEYRRTRG